MDEVDANFFVDRIGAGVSEALNTCRFFLGVETEIFENADIHPEYVTTVEVAKKLTGIDRYVSLETHMKHLRRHAGGMARMRNLQDRPFFQQVPDILRDYKFGKKDSRRVDIVVRPSAELRPPMLLAEAKLGVGNVTGIIEDIDRVMRLLEMYHRLRLLDDHPVYGAVLFHSALEGGVSDSADLKAQGLLAAIDAHLSSLRRTDKWLYAKAGLLSAETKHQPIQGYWEQSGENEGEGEHVFAKTSFTFSPGLVLLSHRSDVDEAKF